MRKAKIIYYDKDGNMVRTTRNRNKSQLIKSEVLPNTTRKKRLKAVSLEWLNNGWVIWFSDDTGRKYPMSSSALFEYLKNNDIDFGSMRFQFLQQSDTYSIGFVRDFDNETNIKI